MVTVQMNVMSKKAAHCKINIPCNGNSSPTQSSKKLTEKVTRKGFISCPGKGETDRKRLTGNFDDIHKLTKEII